MATDIERLTVLIEANTKSYENAMAKLQKQTAKALKASENSVKGLDARLAALQGTVSRVAGVFGLAFGGRALLAFIKNGIEAGSTIGEMANKLGITTTAYQELTFVADQAGASQEDVNAAFKGMIKVLGEAADGSKQAQDDLAKLGITFDAIKGKSPDQVFTLILDRLSKIHDPLQRGAAELAVFGKSGLQLGEMAQLGAKGMDALIQKAHDVGYVLSPQIIQNAKDAADTLKLIGDVGSAAGVALASDFKPAIDAIAKLVTSPEFQQGLDKTASFLSTIIKFLAENPGVLTALGAAAAGYKVGGAGGAAVGVLGTALFSGGGLAGKAQDEMSPEIVARIKASRAAVAASFGSSTGQGPFAGRVAAAPAGNSGASGGWKPPPDTQAQTDAYNKLAAALKLQTTNLEASDREQFVANEVAKLGVKATADQKAGIEALAGSLYDARLKQQALNDANKFFAETAAEGFEALLPKIQTGNDALDSMIQKLEDAVAQALLLGEGPLAGIFGTAATTSGGTGGILGSLLGLFGHAGGGTVSGNKPVRVGERGPELFIPNTAGRIATGGAANDSGARAVHLNIVVNGARGNQEIQTMVAQGVSTGLSAYDKGKARQQARAG